MTAHRYPPLPAAGRTTTKQLARLLESDVRAAENIRRGHWPQARHSQKIIRAFGRDVLDAVFSAELEEVEARLENEERHARQVYLAARARLEAVRAPLASDDDPLLPFEDLGSAPSVSPPGAP